MSGSALQLSLREPSVTQLVALPLLRAEEGPGETVMMLPMGLQVAPLRATPIVQFLATLRVELLAMVARMEKAPATAVAETGRAKAELGNPRQFPIAHLPQTTMIKRTRLRRRVHRHQRQRPSLMHLLEI